MVDETTKGKFEANEEIVEMDKHNREIHIVCGCERERERSKGMPNTIEMQITCK